MEPRINVANNKVFVNELTLEFEYNIRKTIVWEDKVFVLLSIPTGIELGLNEINNLFSISLDAIVLWRVDNSTNGKINDFPFEGITMTKNNELRAFDFYGRNYLVNMDNGKISDLKIFR
ncbi:MAG: hypothetical protein RR565_11090 [Erysipelothrix sp.]